MAAPESIHLATESRGIAGRAHAPGRGDGDAIGLAQYFAGVRRREFARLDVQDEAYLDYTGSALYFDSHLRWHFELLQSGVFGNPHAEGPASLHSTEWIETARSAVLAFVDADPAAYEVVFTANASSAARLVGESFPFQRRSRLVLTADNHNSVLGVREFARAAGATVAYVPLGAELRLADVHMGLPGNAPHASLLAFPAQSNFSGVRHPLGLVRLAQSFGYHVLLDASAYVPTASLSLRRVPADFVILSLYKVLGYPTGVGALIVSRDAFATLHRPWFSGGTVEFASVQNGVHLLRRGARGFEDGTPDFLALSAVSRGFMLLSEVGIERVGEHVRFLTAEIIAGLTALHHRNGRPMVHVYGPATMEARGGTVAFNLRDAHGGWIPHTAVEAKAGARRVSLRSGCFCNPGAAERAFGFDAQRAAACVHAGQSRAQDAGFSIEAFGRCMGHPPVGAVRASVGVASSTRDVARLLDALEEWRA